MLSVALGCFLNSVSLFLGCFSKVLHLGFSVAISAHLMTDLYVMMLGQIFPEIPSEFWEMIESHNEMHDEQVNCVKEEGKRRKGNKLISCLGGFTVYFFEVLDQL